MLCLLWKVVSIECRIGASKVKQVDITIDTIVTEFSSVLSIMSRWKRHETMRG